MLLNEQFDADEILRDMDDGFTEEEVSEEDARELDFGNTFNENANFRDMASDMDSTEDIWE